MQGDGVRPCLRREPPDAPRRSPAIAPGPHASHRAGRAIVRSCHPPGDAQARAARRRRGRRCPENRRSARWAGPVTIAKAPPNASCNATNSEGSRSGTLDRSGGRRDIDDGAVEIEKQRPIRARLRQVHRALHPSLRGARSAAHIGRRVDRRVQVAGRNPPRLRYPSKALSGAYSLTAMIAGRGAFSSASRSSSDTGFQVRGGNHVAHDPEGERLGASIALVEIGEIHQRLPRHAVDERRHGHCGHDVVAHLGQLEGSRRRSRE